MKKFFISILITFFIITMIFTNICAATILVTEEKLESSFKKYAESSSSSTSDLTMNINKENKTIKLSIDGENYIVNYDLSDKPTFSVDMSLNINMTDDQFASEFGKMSALIVPFVLVSDIAGIDSTDSLCYFASVILSNSSLSSSSSDDSSEITLVNDKLLMLKSKSSVSDTFDQFDYKYTLVVNTDADFSIMKGYAEKMTQTALSITEAARKVAEEGNETAKQVAEKASQAAAAAKRSNNNTSVKKLPQTGRSITLKDALYAIISLSTICIFILLIKDFRSKKII